MFHALLPISCCIKNILGDGRREFGEVRLTANSSSQADRDTPRPLVQFPESPSAPKDRRVFEVRMPRPAAERGTASVFAAVLHESYQGCAVRAAAPRELKSLLEACASIHPRKEKEGGKEVARRRLGLPLLEERLVSQVYTPSRPRYTFV